MTPKTKAFDSVWMRNLAGACAAGLLIGAAAGPSSAEAVNFPVAIDFADCWSQPSCAYPPGGRTFTLNRDGTFTDSSGYQGTYVVDKPNDLLTITYSSGVLYSGVHIGNGCLEGTMTSPYGIQGTWAGCRF